MKLFLRGVAAGIALVTILGALLGSVWIASHRFSARAAPGRFDAPLLRRLRLLVMEEAPPPAAPDDSPEAVRRGLVRFAEECAICHANDGSGETALARHLYPPILDLRLPGTQTLTDGELFSVIENGIRFTAMPGRYTGTPEGERGSWELTQFVRHLPDLTSGELALMRQFNPVLPRTPSLPRPD